MSGDQTLHVTVARHRDSILVTLRGDLDLQATPVLDGAIGALRPLAAPLVIDMGDVEFMDSSGLRALLAIRELTVADTGAVPRLTRCADIVLRVLEVTRTESLLDIDR